MAISTRDALIDYCFHQLGSPVIQVELEEQQVSYCVDNAIDRWQSAHSDGSVRRFIPHTITQDDMDNRYITIPSGILSVIRVLPLNYGMASNNLNGMGMFNPVYQYRLNDFWDINRGGLSTYNDIMTNLQMVQDMFQPDVGINFNRYSSKMYLEVDWKAETSYIFVGALIIVECFVILDEDEAPLMYGDFWLKKYTTALMKQQWGTNLKKYSGAQLPGGITVNGQIIYDEAEREIGKLENQLETEFSTPAIFFMG